MEEEHGRARVVDQYADVPSSIEDSIAACPVSCIHWVSGPMIYGSRRSIRLPPVTSAPLVGGVDDAGGWMRDEDDDDVDNYVR